jgi:hypothetical protein
MQLYAIGWSEQGPLKLGRSSDPQARLSALQTGCPYTLKVLATGHIVRRMYSRHWGGLAIERALHRQLKDKRIRGEWFDVTLDEIRAQFPKRPGEDGHVEWRSF